MAEEIDTTTIIRSVIAAVEATYGSLGFTAFRIHTIRKNHKENMFIIKYSFIPREKEAIRIFYRAKIDIKANALSDIQEIKEEDLAKDENKD